MKIATIACAAALLLGATACSTTAYLQPPGAILAHPSPEVTYTAIHAAMQRRGWVAETETAGVVVARLYVRSHQLRAAISYVDGHVQIQFVDSVNLDQEIDASGRVRIHGRANTWLRNLGLSISDELERARVGGPVVIVATPPVP